MVKFKTVAGTNFGNTEKGHLACPEESEWLPERDDDWSPGQERLDAERPARRTCRGMCIPLALFRLELCGMQTEEWALAISSKAVAHWGCGVGEEGVEVAVLMSGVQLSPISSNLRDCRQVSYPLQALCSPSKQWGTVHSDKGYGSSQARTFRSFGLWAESVAGYTAATSHDLDGLPSVGSTSSLPCFPSGVLSSLPNFSHLLGTEAAMAWSQVCCALEFGFWGTFSSLGLFLLTWFPRDPAGIWLADPWPRLRVEDKGSPSQGCFKAWKDHAVSVLGLRCDL